jgi:hypothetical protein
MPFNSIPLDHPDLASVPDQPGLALAPIVQRGPPRGYFIFRSREQRSPDRLASIARRRRLAASGMLPPGLAAQLTHGEQAVAHIVAAEFLAYGVCDLSRNAIAARAGVCHALAERTMLRLERLGWLTVTRRPRSGRRHLSNLSRITSPEWLAWLARGNRKAKSIESCSKALFNGSFRGVQKSPPRSQGLKTTDNRPVNKAVENPNRPAVTDGGGPLGHL